MSFLLRARFSDTTMIWLHGTKVVLSLMILTLLMALTGGVVKIMADLYLLLSQPLEVVFRRIIVNTLLLLAIVEVLKTTVTYFSEGRGEGDFYRRYDSRGHVDRSYFAMV